MNPDHFLHVRPQASKPKVRIPNNIWQLVVHWQPINNVRKPNEKWWKIAIAKLLLFLSNDWLPFADPHLGKYF